MTRRERIENRGYKVMSVMNRPKGMEGSYHAVKGSTRLRGTSVTDLHRQIFGY